MSEFDFILDNVRFSYSSISGYDTCHYAYKLTYIDCVPRVNNFYGEFGTLVHSCFEKYFTGELEAMELSEYYRINYDKIVVTYPPTYPPGMGERYRIQGQNFFDNFSFEKEKYEVLLVEDKIDFDLNFARVTARPDLILKNKATGEITLVDYKTSTPYKIDKVSGKETADKKKLDGYSKQMHLYTYAIRTQKNIAIDKICMWYPRLDKMVVSLWDALVEEKTLKWFDETITKILADNKFAYNNTNQYFCNELCSVRNSCEYR